MNPTATEHRPSRARAIVIGVLLLVLVAAAIWLWRSRSAAGAQQGSPQLPPAAVAVAKAEAQTWRTLLRTVGTLEAERGVDVTSARAGIVSAIRFGSGERVRRGEVIAQLDDAADRAALDTLTAQLAQAQADLVRNRRLLARGAVAEADAERAATAVKTLRSQIAEARALIADKRITAPFAGEICIRRIDLGQFVQPGEPVVTLQQIEPIFVNFTLPARDYGRLARGQAIELTVDAWPDQRFAGTVAAISPLIDERTRNFLAQGRLANAERRLRPGMFADVTVTLPDAREVITVPVTAVTYSPSGDSIYVVRPGQAKPPPGQGGSPNREPKAPREEQGERDNAAQAPSRAASQPGPPPPLMATRVPVRTGERRGDRVAVLEGLEAGQTIVTAGQLKLFEGAPVAVAPETPASDAARTASR